jgi:hypothetical protein
MTPSVPNLMRWPAAAGLASLLALSACVAPTDGSEEQSTGSTSAGQSTGSTVPDGETEIEGPPPANLSFDGASSVIIPNSPGTVTTTGRQRVMTALLGSEPGRYLGGPDLPVTVGFEAVNSDDRGQADGTWLTTSAAALGLYVSYFEFPSPGLWEVVVSAQGSEIARTLIEVTEDSPVPGIGDPAPATESLTGENAEEISVISTDRTADPDFYDLSIADAVANGRPTVIAFVTPAFCQTALCGPTLEAVKGATAGRDEIDVVHVEPYDLALATQGVLEPIASMEEWGLQTEPWVFVVDGEGIVSAMFEGIMGQHELEAALASL